MTLDLPMEAPSEERQTLAITTDTELDRTGKLAVWAAVISPLFLSQIAYNFGTFPVSVDFICYALFALYLLVSGAVSLRLLPFLVFVSAVVLAAFRIPFSTSSASWTSLLLLFSLYLPFPFRLKDGHNLRPVQGYIVGTFVSAATVIGIIAIAQIVLVNGMKLNALTNIHFLLPESIRNAGAFTYSREGGEGFLKANGFFLRESSILSMVMAIAIVVEYHSRARWRIFGILGAGLIASFSGTGMLALIAAFVLPKSAARIPLFFASFAGLLVALFLLYNLQIPGLSTWFDRLSEFTTPSTSGYARYVAPAGMVQISFDNGEASTLLGNGAGSYLRDVTLLKTRYEINDPTWAKLVYEYGLLGFVLILSTYVARLYSSSLPAEACNCFLFIWVSTGVLLIPSFVLLAWVLSLVPKQHRPSNSQKPNHQ